MDMVWGQRKGLAEVLNKLRYTNCNYLAISVSENIKSFSESIFVVIMTLRQVSNLLG